MSQDCATGAIGVRGAGIVRHDPISPRYRDWDREAAPNMFDWRNPPGRSEWSNDDRKAIQCGHCSPGGHPRDRAGNARERSLANIPLPTWSGYEAERRIDHDHTGKPNRARAGLKRAQFELHVIESQLRLRGLPE